MAEKKPLPACIPPERDYLLSYRKRTGRAVDDPDYEFCMAHSLFWPAVILQGILKCSLNGTASNAQARETGLKARGIAEAAWSQVTTNFTKGR